MPLPVRGMIYSFHQEWELMKRALICMIAVCIAVTGGCGGVDNSVKELPLSTETGYTPEQMKNMKGVGSLVDPNEPKAQVLLE
jgi:hypothetical protein